MALYCRPVRARSRVTGDLDELPVAIYTGTSMRWVLCRRQIVRVGSSPQSGGSYSEKEGAIIRARRRQSRHPAELARQCARQLTTGHLVDHYGLAGRGTETGKWYVWWLLCIQYRAKPRNAAHRTYNWPSAACGSSWGLVFAPASGKGDRRRLWSKKGPPLWALLGGDAHDGLRSFSQPTPGGPPAVAAARGALAYGGYRQPQVSLTDRSGAQPSQGSS